jgi:putative transcriptional regulator
MKVINKYSINKGEILVSKPNIGDDLFHNSVVFITEYTQIDVVGFILNKPLDINLNDIIDNCPPFDVQIFNGGPVSSNNLYFIHRVPSKIPESIHIVNDLYWGGDFDSVIGLIKNNELRKEDILFFLGYSGWDQGQLENELKCNSWEVHEIKKSLFDWDVNTIWESYISDSGQEYKIWAVVRLNRIAGKIKRVIFLGRNI